jgi:hypothetical protein
MDTMQATGQYREHVPTSATYSPSSTRHYDDQQDMDPEGYYTNQPVSSNSMICGFVVNADDVDL